MIVQTAVLIMSVTDTVWRSGRARQQSRRGSAMQIVNDIITCGTYPARYPSARSRAAALDGNDVIDVCETIEHRCHPVFQQNIDLNAGQKTFERKKRRSSEHRVANRPQPHD